MQCNLVMLWLKLTLGTRFRRKLIFFRRGLTISFNPYIFLVNALIFGYALTENDIRYAISPKPDIFWPKRQYPSNPIYDYLMQCNLIIFWLKLTLGARFRQKLIFSCRIDNFLQTIHMIS